MNTLRDRKAQISLGSWKAWQQSGEDMESRCVCGSVCVCISRPLQGMYISATSALATESWGPVNGKKQRLPQSSCRESVFADLSHSSSSLHDAYARMITGEDG